MTKLFVVVNPVAGAGNQGKRDRTLRETIRSSGLEHEIYETTGHEDLASVVRSALARGCDRTLVVGGDGTVSGVADALVGTECALGIVPTGTGNVLALELGIPLGMQAALKLALEDPARRRIDVMDLGSCQALLNVSAGFSAAMIRSTRQDAKRRLGRLAYILAGIRELRGTETARFRVIVDGQVREYVAMEVHVVNIGTIAEPSIRWSDEVNPDDGRVNVFIVRARRLGDYVSVAGSILLGRPEKDTHIDHLLAEREVEISTKEPVTVQADGDPLGETPLRVTVRPRALDVIVRG